MADPSILGPYSSALPPQNGTANGAMGPDPQAARKQAIKLNDGPMIVSIRQRRKPVDFQMLRNHDCWMGLHREQGFKSETFNYFVPSARRSIERFVSRCRKMLCGSSPDAFEVYPAVEADPNAGMQAEAIKNYLMWRFWRLKFRSQFSQIIRTICLYGRGVVKTYPDTRDVPGQVWPSFRVVDPFRFYQWPETATSINQTQVLFEDTMMPWEEYNTLSQMTDETGQRGCDPIDPATLTKPDWSNSFQIERLGRSGISPPSDLQGGASPQDNEPIKIVAITERWARVGTRWEQAWLAWNVPNGPQVVRLTMQDVCPYRMAIVRQLPGELYTNCMMSDLEPFNRVMNDQFNMTMEGQATAVFPPVAVNPDMIVRADSLIFGPRRKWQIPPEGVKELNFSGGVATGVQGIQMTSGMMDQYSGSSPLAEGTPQRGMPRAGFAISSLIGLAMSDIQDMAELIEDEILTPLLSDLWRMTMMLPPEQVVSIPGAEGVTSWRGTVQQLLGAPSFRWVGTLQAQDMQVRAQRMMTLLGTVAKIYPQMVTQGWDIDFGVLFKRLWRDGMGERGADTLVGRTQVYQMFQQFLQQMGLGPDGQPLQTQGQPGQPGQPPQRPAGGGGSSAPMPVSAEQMERQQSRAQAEGGVGQQMAGMVMG